jgi:hypothetical protein
VTELMLPGGLVRIDESHVWRELSRWIAETGGDAMLRQEETGFRCRLFIGSDPESSWAASSRLSLADCVANALQAAVAGRAA